MATEGPPTTKQDEDLESLQRMTELSEAGFTRGVEAKQKMFEAIRDGDDEKRQEALRELTELRGPKLALIESAYAALQARQPESAVQALELAKKKFPDDPDVLKAQEDILDQLRSQQSK